MYSSVYRIIGNGGELLVEANGANIIFDIVAGHRRLGVAIDSRVFFEVLANLVEESTVDDDGQLFMQTLCIREDGFNCKDYMRVPDLMLIADMLLALRSILSRTPRPAKTGDKWAWSPEEEAAARKASLLLEITVLLLKKPKAMINKLPSDVELLIQRHDEGTLVKYMEKKKVVD